MPLQFSSLLTTIVLVPPTARYALNGSLFSPAKARTTAPDKLYRLERRNMLRSNQLLDLTVDPPDLSDRLRNSPREAVLHTLQDHNSSVVDHNILPVGAMDSAARQVGHSIHHGSEMVHTARPANYSVQPPSWVGSKAQRLCEPLEAVPHLADAQEVASIDLVTFCSTAILI
jgi:hypothetical protein